ncbi:SafA/ExsA family spore coat assembly protein [Bacillus sp. BHET2]|uniref:SafA/ExsA family spore coat assembly protein n=1 Tax=Bacillus sp. BHET2 TaxID=2583818 RepID=UPI00110F0E5D|nr:SafA/ExsA family spore coat assembly protein [Bacillus sp. BHET2]TMU83752.1 SafA/ExsA family spore coat assembly protein [Bacillus sp. BHET2]
MKTKRALYIVLSSFVISLLALTEAAAGNMYLVKKGDTLWNISKRFQINLSELIEANTHLSNPDVIYPGQKITIPSFTEASSFENRIMELTNKERQKNGLPPLKLDSELSRVAFSKSRNMRDVGYFSHKSPTYGTPTDMMKAFHIQFNEAAENIAAGQTSPEQVVREWMESPGHRKHILTGSYTHIGVGYAEGGAYETYWTLLLVER